MNRSKGLAKSRNSVFVQDGFFDQAAALRGHFEDLVHAKNQSQPGRFVWDYFFVENQYEHLRTPAYHFFPPKVYRQFHQQLVQWGRENLGCHDISPPWLSLYLSGHRQNWHRDVPHGPWAFVYSLSPKSLKFQGGRTCLAKEELLNYWPHLLRETQGRHEGDVFFQEIEPKQNRLIVFDPQLPHAVSEVEGARNPTEGRLVIHGWFVQPRPYVRGGLSTASVQTILEDFLTRFFGKINECDEPLMGTLSWSLSILPSGNVKQVSLLTHTLRGLGSDKDIQSLLKSMARQMQDLRFRKSTKPSELVVPLIFESATSNTRPQGSVRRHRQD